MYKETQQFRQLWLWVLLTLVFALPVYRKEPVGVGIIAFVIGLFWFLRLETIINTEGVSYRWFPFQRKYRVIKWTEIEQITVRNYTGLGEFGGWGIRFSWKATAHTVYGNWGIDIRLKGKKRYLLIGTQNPDDVRRVINKEHIVDL